MEYPVRQQRRPNPSDSHAAAIQPNIVPIESSPVPYDAIFAAPSKDMQALRARNTIAVGSYTVPAQRPMTATGKGADIAIVCRR